MTCYERKITVKYRLRLAVLQRALRSLRIPVVPIYFGNY